MNVSNNSTGSHCLLKISLMSSMNKLNNNGSEHIPALILKSFLRILTQYLIEEYKDFKFSICLGEEEVISVSLSV